MHSDAASSASAPKLASLPPMNPCLAPPPPRRKAPTAAGNREGRGASFSFVYGAWSFGRRIERLYTVQDFMSLVQTKNLIKMILGLAQRKCKITRGRGLQNRDSFSNRTRVERPTRTPSQIVWAAEMLRHEFLTRCTCAAISIRPGWSGRTRTEGRVGQGKLQS